MGDGDKSDGYSNKGCGQAVATMAMVMAKKMRDGEGNEVVGDKEGDGESGKSNNCWCLIDKGCSN